MECDCETLDKGSLINYICEEIQELELDQPWLTYLNFIDDRFKVANFTWSFTRTDTKKWFSRVLENMQKDELIFWAHKELFCVNHLTTQVIAIKD